MASSGDDETMEEQSDTTMDQSQGTFISVTSEPTVNGTRTVTFHNSENHKKCLP